jgi:hypothetical protein
MRYFNIGTFTKSFKLFVKFTPLNLDESRCKENEKVKNETDNHFNQTFKTQFLPELFWALKIYKPEESCVLG